MGHLARRKRLLTGLAAGVVSLVLLAVLNVRWGLWELSAAQGSYSMADGLPACRGLWLREGFTYLFRDPHRGEIVTFHARGQLGSGIAPDPHSRQLGINKRVIGVPGDVIADRHNRVYVNGHPADDIPTLPFAPVHLGPKQYYVLGDNRSASDDSRDFGPVPRAAIYSRAVLIVWPLGRFGVPEYDKAETPPGPLCGN
jgi:signal peptidase I